MTKCLSRFKIIIRFQTRTSKNIRKAIFYGDKMANKFHKTASAAVPSGIAISRVLVCVEMVQSWSVYRRLRRQSSRRNV